MHDNPLQSHGNSPSRGLLTPFFALVLIGIVFLVFSNTLSNDFAFDDNSTIKNNPAIRDLKYARLYFTQPFFLVGRPESGPVLYDYYRPVVLISYLVDYSIWGLNPKGWHLTNIIMHGAAAALVFLLFLRLRLGREAAFVSAALFAIHPAIADSVASIAGRSDPLCSIFILASLYCYIGARRKRGARMIPGLACSCALFSAALLTKENAIVVPLLITIYELLRPDDAEERKLKLIMPFCAIVAAYMLWRSRIVPTSISFSGGFTELCLRLMTAAKMAGSYFCIALFPHDLGFETYSSITDSIGDPKAVAWMIAVILAGGAVAWLSMKAPKPGFFALWFFACLSPFGYFVVFHPGSELFTPPHFLYLPLIGLVGIAATGLAGLARKAGPWPKPVLAKSAFALAALVIFLFSAQTMQRNTTWRDDFTFFSAMRKHAPQSARIHIGLANTLMKRGQPAHALAEYAAAWKLARSQRQEEPEYLSAPPDAEASVGRLKISNYYAAAALAGMGDAYRSLGEHDNSIRSYEDALTENAFDSTTHMKLARAYEHTGRFDEAIETLERAMRIDPKLPGAASLLEIVREKKVVYEEADRVYRKALQAGRTDSPEALYSQALLARLSGKLVLAEALLNETLAKDPAHYGANMALGRILHKRGECEAAIGNFSAAFAEDPTSALAAYSLALASLALQDTLTAERWAARAYDVSPERYYLDFLEAIRDRGETRAN